MHNWADFEFSDNISYFYPHHKTKNETRCYMANLFRKKSIQTILADSAAGMEDGHGFGLKKVLGVKDLTLLGVAAVIGAGIFRASVRQPMTADLVLCTSIFLPLLPVVLLPCVMLSLLPQCLFQVVHIRIPMLPLGSYLPGS